MKIATQNQAFFPTTILEKFKYIKAMGFDGYEIDGKLLVENLAEVKAAMSGDQLQKINKSFYALNRSNPVALGLVFGAML